MTPLVGTRVKALLGADAAVLARASTRVYPAKAPQNAVEPRIVYRVIDERRTNALDGQTKYVRGRLQVDCYARGYEAAQLLANEVNAALVAATAPGTASHRPVSFLELGREDLYEDDTELHRVSIDFSFTGQET